MDGREGSEWVSKSATGDSTHQQQTIPKGNLTGPVAVTMKKCQVGMRKPSADENRNSGSQLTKPSVLGWKLVGSKPGFPLSFWFRHLIM